jgi:hypothetical protein
MLGSAWSNQKCLIKSGFGVSDRFYQYTEYKQTLGLEQGSIEATDTWCIIHWIIIHTVTTYFIGIILIYVYGMIQHKRVGEGLIVDPGLAASAHSSNEITSSRNKQLSPD